MKKDVEILEITDELVEKQSIGGKVVIGNKARGCRLQRKAVKKNGKWGIVDYGRFEPFVKCEKVTFEGLELNIKFYIG